MFWNADATKTGIFGPKTLFVVRFDLFLALCDPFWYPFSPELTLINTQSPIDMIQIKYSELQNQVHIHIERIYHLRIYADLENISAYALCRYPKCISLFPNETTLSETDATTLNS